MSEGILGTNHCNHTGVPKGDHQPDLQGCESAWLNTNVSDYTNSTVGKIKQAIEMLGLPEKQEKATKRAIADILWAAANTQMSIIWKCTAEGKADTHLPFSPMFGLETVERAD